MFVYVIFFVVMVVVLFLMVIGPMNREGYISSLAGPVDMLQLPKQLLMDGYRFQNSLIPPGAYGDNCVYIPEPRVGAFKEKAYIEEGFESSAVAAISQINSKGEQDKYLNGDKNTPIEDSEKPFGKFSIYARPARTREVNYPNQVFSWGDVINRYCGQININ